VPVALLFADVRGYTALCEQLDPDEVTELVQRFYETSSAAPLAQECLLGQIAGATGSSPTGSHRRGVSSGPCR
jgi:class 3 adenylate cyclase